jgi:hypothetical protein
MPKDNKWFKEGDFVEILDMDSCLQSDYKVGEICQIKYVSGIDSAYDYHVFTPSGVGAWGFLESELGATNEY